MKWFYDLMPVSAMLTSTGRAGQLLNGFEFFRMGGGGAAQWGAKSGWLDRKWDAVGRSAASGVTPKCFKSGIALRMRAKQRPGRSGL